MHYPTGVSQNPTDEVRGGLGVGFHINKHRSRTGTPNLEQAHPVMIPKPGCPLRVDRAPTRALRQLIGGLPDCRGARHKLWRALRRCGHKVRHQHHYSARSRPPAATRPHAQELSKTPPHGALTLPTMLSTMPASQSDKRSVAQ